MAVGGLGVSGGPLNSTLLLIWCSRRSAVCLPSCFSSSVRRRRGAVSCGEALLADLLRAPPHCGVPDLDVVVQADHHHVPFEARELAKALGDGHPALAVGAGLHGAREERPLHVSIAPTGPFPDLAGLHIELLRAPEGEAAVFLAGDVRHVAQLVAKACWEDEARLGVARVLILAEERRSPPVHHFTTTNPSMARQTPPCCTTSRHPTPQPSTRQPHHSKGPLRETAVVARPPSLPVRTRVAAGAGLAVAGLSRRVGAGEGSVIGGRVLLALDSGALARLAAGRTIALVSGTNGKTTTTRMLAAALETRGPVTTNSAGANLLSGLVTTLARGGTSDAPAVLEVDEGLVPSAMAALHPSVLLLLNLSRDQLDRIGEVRIP